MSTHWLLLLYAVPHRNSSKRVGLWRSLKKLGAVSLNTSAYLLPDLPGYHERFQWLANQIREDGGQASLVRTPEIEGMAEIQIHTLFNDARAEDYSVLITELTELLRVNRRKIAESYAPALERLRDRMTEIQRIDFFNSPRGGDALMLFGKAERLLSPRAKPAAVARIKAADFRNKTWLTRPRPEIDRIASAWLIKRFVDADAKFVFAPRPEDYPNAIPYDMVNVAFTHHGDDCTFETLLKRFDLAERPLKRLAEMIHEADLNDGKFSADEAIGLDWMFKGLSHLGWTDDQILQHGFVSLDAFFARLKEE
jgi:hypothetical protein